MITNTFFVCPACGNDREFNVFTSNFQTIKQCPESGKRIDESDALPSLRQNDMHIECKRCSQRLEYDSAAAIGKKYVQTTQKLFKAKYA